MYYMSFQCTITEYNKSHHIRFFSIYNVSVIDYFHYIYKLWKLKLSCWLFNTKIVLIRHSFKNHYKSIWKRHESRVKGQKLLHTLSSQQVHEEVLIYMYSTVLLYIPRTSKNLSTHFRVYCRITSKVKKCCLYVEKLRLLYMKQDINTENNNKNK